MEGTGILTALSLLIQMHNISVCYSSLLSVLGSSFLFLLYLVLSIIWFVCCCCCSNEWRIILIIFSNFLLFHFMHIPPITCPFIVDVQLDSFHLLTNVNSAAMSIWYMFLFESLSSFLFRYMYQRVKLHGHMIILCLTFWGTSTIFYSSWTILHFHRQCMRSHFFMTSPTTVIIIFYFLIIVILVGMKRYLMVGLICISLMNNNAEFLFMCLWTIVYLL